MNLKNDKLKTRVQLKISNYSTNNVHWLQIYHLEIVANLMANSLSVVTHSKRREWFWKKINHNF